MLDLSISLVNHNNRQLLDECLHSIYENTPKISFDVFVVDNASTDGGADTVRLKYPQVNLVVNRSRQGFAANHNQILLHSRGRYALILNEDTVILPHALDMMVTFMDDHPEAGAVGPRVLNPDGTLQRTWMTRVSPLTFFWYTSPFCKRVLDRFLDVNRF